MNRLRVESGTEIAGITVVAFSEMALSVKSTLTFNCKRVEEMALSMFVSHKEKRGVAVR